ncbi:MAG: hypothetical protein COB42_01275 [Sulfurimonas sp.]|nr:MAG: hypothetical protein COB42_01275 [Sulfurimonas sp.]
MKVAQYTFQSPSASQVQVGKLDPSSLQEKESTVSKKASQQKSVQSKTIGEILAKDTPLKAQVAPTIDTSRILDVYV